MKITVNGEIIELSAPHTPNELLSFLGIDSNKVAIECNLEIIPRSLFDTMRINENDKIEIVHFIGGGSSDNRDSNTELVKNIENDTWNLAGRCLKSRLIIGTGKYNTFEENRLAAEAAEVEIITVAVRRVNLLDPKKPMLIDFLDPNKYILLPNTAGCYTSEEAVRTLRLAREAGGWSIVKLEVLGDKKTLYPNMPETLKAAELLVKENFHVMVYCSDDPIQAKRLEEIGCSAIMPLGAPIGSGLGIQNPANIVNIIENSTIPVIVDAGVGTASDATIAMELGCDAVLMNTAIAEAQNPVLMARSMFFAIKAGRSAFLAGRMKKRKFADPSSPIIDMI